MKKQKTKINWDKFAKEQKERRNIDELLICFLKKDKVKIEEVTKALIYYQTICQLEKEHGKTISYSLTEKEVLSRLKKLNLGISKKQFQKDIFTLIATGVIFIPKKGFVQRIII